jgi:glutathione S-transferase
VGYGAFLVGEEITLADISVAAMMTYARATKFPFDSFPSIGRWYARIEALGAWKASAECVPEAKRTRAKSDRSCHVAVQQELRDL